MAFKDTMRKTIRFTQKELPQIKEWPISGNYILQIEVTLKSKGDEMWDEEGLGGTFLVTGVKAIEENKIKKLKEKFKPRY